jgi:glycosyltransferase involved in cell wall biosynthesis
MSQSGESKFKKVLIVARAFPPFFPVGYSIRVIKFIKYLPAFGWLPVVLTINEQEEYENTRKLGSETLLTEIQPQVKIYRTIAGEPSLRFLEKLKKFSQRNWMARLIVRVLDGSRRWVFRNIFLPDYFLNWLPFAVSRGLQIVRHAGIDVIFVTCPPHSATLIGACLKRLTGKPLILDFRDDWVGTPWYLSRHVIIRLIEARMENWVVKTADRVILVTESSYKAFLERYPTQSHEKIVLIPNGCDLGELEEMNSISPLARNPKFMIVHAGSLNDTNNWTRSPAAFFQAVHHIFQQQPELAEKVNIVFAGGFPEGYRKLADEMGLIDIIKAPGHLPHLQVLRLLKSADLLLAIATERFSTAIPGKIYEYWAVGGPPILLISYPGVSTSLIQRYNLGFTIDPTDITAIEKAILTVYKNYQNDTPMRIRTMGIEAFDRRTLTCSLAQVLSNAFYE